MSTCLVRRSFAVLGLAIALSAAPLHSRAATLPLGTDSHTFFPNLFGFVGGGVTASDGSTPVPGSPYSASVPSIPASGGSMTIDYINGGSQVEARFDVTLFSDADPFVQTGTWGPGATPVTLQINELRYDSPATGDPATVVDLTGSSQFIMFNLSTTATMRGSLTVGGVTTPFTQTATGCCASRDAAPPNQLDLNVFGFLNPYDVVVGFGGGPGLQATFGVTLPAMNVATVNGVTFSTGPISTDFYTLTYLPEPGSVALLALSGLSLALLRRR
ncbi:MAG TPA: PEP-CTERM sorting domain-containing protein [Myxococcota bacterium]|nr:PEP-CTERM sorting domain-containing protein [Myxococcota bacterium]